MFRNLVTRTLTQWGHTVVGEAGSVEQAVRLAAELQPDLALVDIGLPDGDGYALTQQLLAMPYPPRVVLISSDSDPANESAALQVGASGFIPKDELSNARFRRLIRGEGHR